jgi:metal-sulfur cluster biosynthetic enzyme
MPPQSQGPAPAGAPYDYSGPEELLQPIDGALRQVVDPEVAMTIVDIGLVYRVTLADDTALVTMTMTSAACPVADLIREDVETELGRVLPASMRIRVELVWEPAWTVERMSPRARAFMGW